jgi:hypothetical protein
MVSFTPLPLYSQGKSPRYPSGRRLDRLQSWSGHDDEEKNSQLLPSLGLFDVTSNICDSVMPVIFCLQTISHTEFGAIFII